MVNNDDNSKNNDDGNTIIIIIVIIINSLFQPGDFLLNPPLHKYLGQKILRDTSHLWQLRNIENGKW